MDIVDKKTKQYFLPSNIRLLRKQKKWSQEELAQAIGLNRGNIASYENGTAEPKICNLLKMASLFEVSLLDLIQKDLADPYFTALNYKTPDRTAPLTQAMEKYLDSAQEIQKVMDGLNICCRYKVKNMNGELPKEMQLVAMHFEELYDTAQTLLEQHMALLKEMDFHRHGPSKQV